MTGVVASVISLITGATGAGGFTGFGRNFRRQDVTHFACPVEGEVCFERTDSGASVQLAMHMDRVEADPRTNALMKRSLTELAAPHEAHEFAALWQERVKRILIDHADDRELIAAIASTV